MLLHLISWPHFDLSGILQAVAGAILGFITAVVRQNIKSSK